MLGYSSLLKPTLFIIVVILFGGLLGSVLAALQGEEVFNTYGELANWQLLHMYGFAERPSDNHYDAVS